MVASAPVEEFLRPQELLIILIIVLVLFGGSKLPDLARNLGQASRELRAGMREGSRSDEPAPGPDTDHPVDAV